MRRYVEDFVSVESLAEMYGCTVYRIDQIILEVATTLQVKRNVEFQSSTRLSDGQVQFSYQETQKGSTNKGMVEMPPALRSYSRVDSGAGRGASGTGRRGGTPPSRRCCCDRTGCAPPGHRV
ncbi:MAG: DUF2303 family protein [Magnetococcales bacterium]|nr:DUF2303 family protein [Magnetococcales bacterium]